MASSKDPRILEYFSLQLSVLGAESGKKLYSERLLLMSLVSLKPSLPWILRLKEPAALNLSDPWHDQGM